VIGKPEPLPYRVEPLGSDYDRNGFSCGNPALDAYIRQQAGQDVKRKLAAVFVLTQDGKNIAGYYTLSAHAIQADELPPAMSKKLPRLPVPVTLLGRMAISDRLKGKGLGEFVLLSALERAWIGSTQIASWAVIVDAKVGSRDFYLKYSFLPLPNSPHRLFLPIKTIEGLLAK
jgi:predicted GNAT family N-acyltransferase